jgi:putative exporter of polyketide antibiotics
MSFLSSRRFWTPLLALSGSLILVSGLFLFFLLKSRVINDIHEWGSIVFIVACAAHLVLNRQSLLKALDRRATAWTVVAVAVIAVLGMAFSDIQSGHGQRQGMELRNSQEISYQSHGR